MNRASRLILDLMAEKAGVDQSRLDGLDEGEWMLVRQIAAEHRLQPWLHHVMAGRRSELRLPGSVLQEWHKARLLQARKGLHVRALLDRIAALFEANGMPWRALKGSYLAFHAYPGFELRPLRDIDILVPEHLALAAFELLLANGAMRHPDSPGDPAAFLATNQKHLPPLIFPREAVRVEIHGQLLADSCANPALATARIFERPAYRVDGDPVPFLGPESLLLHLAVHAAYDHKFDNGPLTFIDVGHLLQSDSPDWGRFWEMCGQGGQVKGALLVLRLTEHFAGRQLFEHDLRSELPDSALHGLLPAMTRSKDDRVEYGLRERFGDTFRGAGVLGHVFGRLFRSRSELTSEFGADGSSYLVLSLRLWKRLLVDRFPRILRFMRHGMHSEATAAMLAIDAWLDPPDGRRA